MKRKIAIVSNTSWSIYNFRLGLIKHLKSKGFDIVVIAPKDNFTAELLAEDIEFEEINIKNYGINPIRELALLNQLNKIYSKLKPDLIFHYTIKPNIYGSIAASRNKIPSIAITTGLGHLFDFKNWLVTKITFSLYRLAAKLCNEMWFLNDNDHDVFVYKGIIKKEKAKVLKSEGIDLDWFKPKEEKKKTDQITFLYAGRILWDKGVGEFVKAAELLHKKYDNLSFQILGFIDQNNPNSVPYEKISEWQKQKIISYLGETTDIRSYIESATCLLFPSYYREGISRILMEAAAMETPIITTDNVGCKDVVDHARNGFLAEPKNVEDLIVQIERFLSLSFEDRIVMGKLGRKKMTREFAEDKIISKYMQTIDKLLPPNTTQKSKVRSTT